MSSLLTFALDAENQLVHIDTVLNGKACNCTCPYCHKDLIAKNGGEKREHHFAHHNNQECKGAYESALHLLAKDIIEKEGGIMLPNTEEQNFPKGFVKLKNVEIEKWDEELNIRPDAQGLLPDGRRLLIEFLVSHKVKGKKYEIITSKNLLCLEIDIKYEELDRNALTEYLTQDIDGRKWIKKEDIKKKTDNFSLSNPRNALFDRMTHYLKEIFEIGSFKLIFPHDYSRDSEPNEYDLKNLGYDVCKTNETFRGIRCDLLLYRSEKKDRGYIAINFRGRHRNYNSRLPKNLRLIDIIVKREDTEDSLKKRFEKGELSNDGRKVFYLGEWQRRVLEI